MPENIKQPTASDLSASASSIRLVQVDKWPCRVSYAAYVGASEKSCAGITEVGPMDYLVNIFRDNGLHNVASLKEAKQLIQSNTEIALKASTTQIMTPAEHRRERSELS